MRDRLNALGWGLREFCRETDVDPSFFSKVLSGKRSPPSDEAVLRRIARALELDAPSVIVASGRIPTEWSRLWKDPSVFAAVHSLAAGGNRETAQSKSGSWTSSKPSAAPKRETREGRKAPASFGEELL